jgi:apolipoprotein N-acyltransferase
LNPPAPASSAPPGPSLQRAPVPPGLRLIEALALAGLGALQTLAWVATWAWWLPVLALAVLVWRLDGCRPRGAALWGWCYGTGWLLGGVWWLFISMHSYGGLPAPLAALAVLALSAALSLYLAGAAALYAHFRRATLWGDAALFAALFMLAECARGVLFTGFPWVALGYSQVDAPLAVLAPWVGVYGLGAAVAWAAALLAGMARVRLGERPTVIALVVVLLTLPGLAGPWNFTAGAGPLRVALLQTNVKQDEKFSAERLPETLAWVAQELTKAQADLVVTPETAVPLLPYQLADAAPGYWQALVEHFAAPGRAALVGAPLGDFERGYTNSVVGMSPAGAGYRYDKQHLVPFGEFIPPGFRWFTEMMRIPLGDFSRGVPAAPSFAVAGQRVAPNICYEDLFGEELALRFRQSGQAPTVLANVSNIAWFGDTIAIEQHRNISRLRALELQRPVIRATNTGATVAINHRGRVIAELPSATRGVLTATVEGRVGSTPFAWWASRYGLWPLVAAALLLVLGLSGRVVRRGEPSDTEMPPGPAP